ncbi:MAG TPA: endolytic transglycosylase MltG [Acidimicrobiales bacterium]|nr:endolytic transglycosylase MltG [Acidimicrobiales bacterium]
MTEPPGFSGADAAAVDPPASPAARVRSHARDTDHRRRFRRRRLVAAFVAFLVLAAPAWFAIDAYPIGGTGAPVAFEVQPGEPIGQVAATMAGKGIVSSELGFRLDLMLTGTPTVEPGWYEIPTSSSFSAAKAALSSGPNAQVVTVVTAEASWEIAQDLASIMGSPFARRFESYVHNGTVPSPFQPTSHTSLEGLLAPGTYVLLPGESPKDLLSQMIAQFVSRAASVGLVPSTTRNGLNADELVTVASIVEKEGYYAVNMPKVARVVYNRLARSMALTMDATVLYALHQDGGPVTHATEAVKSPYNTYLHIGLTPSPICIPSTQALNATLHPPAGPWLYFVSDASGKMAFASTFAQQLANEALALRDRL